MSDVEKPPPDDSDRDVEFEEDLDPEAPTNSTLVHPPLDDADRPVPGLEDPLDEPEDAFQEENAGTSLDQPSDQSS